MTLTSILGSAVTGLNTSQAALLTTATNISNVNTPGYAREKVELENLVVGNTTAGVGIAEVRRVVDEFLLSELRLVSSDEQKLAAAEIFHNRLQALFGQPDENSSLSGTVDAIFDGLGNIPVDPASIARRTGALNDMSVFADTVSRLAEQVQLLRGDADSRIGIEVEAANKLIEHIAEINPLIATEIVRGGEPNGLLQERDRAILQLSEIMDIRARLNENGAMIVSTRNGLPLIDADVYFQLDYTTQGTISSSSRFGKIEAKRYDVVNQTLDPIGVVIDDELTSGTLRGLLDTRDLTLPALASELGELAAKVVDQLNRIHNENSTIPAPQTLIGRNTGLRGPDAHNFTGKVIFSILNPDNTVFANVPIDFSTIGPTINNMIGSLNLALNPAAGVGFTDGVLTVQAITGGRGIAVVQDPTDPSSRGGRGFSHFFGLNDLMEANRPAHYDTGLAGTDLHGFGVGQTIAFEFLSPTNQVAVQHIETIVDSTFDNLFTSMNGPGALGNFGTFSFDANGALLFDPKPGFEGYRLDLVSDSTQRGTTGLSFGGLFGVGAANQMDRAQGVKVIDDIAEDPAKLALGRVDLSAAPGDPALAAGDPTGALAFQNLQNTRIQFQTAGNLGPIVVKLAEYGAAVIGNSALLAEQLDRRLAATRSLREEIETRSNEVSGVNLDEELAQMIVFQNAFNASARMIAAAQDMLETLMSVIQR
jgi:flagellar hook-associated protein 1